MLFGQYKKNPFKKKTHTSLDNRIKHCKKIIGSSKLIKVKFYEDTIKSNKTFVITDHNFDDDDDCSDTEIITGTWEVDYSSYNKFRGYFIYDDSGRIADAIDHSGVSGIINHPAENTFKIAYPATDENGQEILNNDGNIIYVSIYWGKIID